MHAYAYVYSSTQILKVVCYINGLYFASFCCQPSLMLLLLVVAGAYEYARMPGYGYIHIQQTLTSTMVTRTEHRFQAQIMEDRAKEECGNKEDGWDERVIICIFRRKSECFCSTIFK
jgi:hypothetical protein